MIEGEKIKHEKEKETDPLRMVGGGKVQGGGLQQRKG